MRITASTPATHDRGPPGRFEAERLVLDRYRLRHRIGAGGFGVVWQAIDEKLDRDVAIKIVAREGDGDRVDREALAAARLNHPGIVALYELGADEHDHFLVSELVHGATLAELARGRGLSDRDVSRIGQALCAALSHAHSRGVVHRDVKPANVMVLAEPEGEQRPGGAGGVGPTNGGGLLVAKLTDFGVARLATGDGLTATGDVVGTIAYMAPEQAEGEAVTGAADVYSLALTLYEAFTGTNPVRGAGPAATARRVGRPVPAIGTRRPDLPGQLAEAIDAALEVEPDLRPAPGELARALAATERAMDSRGGLVEPETQERFGLTAVRRAPKRGLGVAGLSQRLAAGLAAGALAYLAQNAVEGAPSGPVAPLAVAVAVALLPRIGWLAAAAVGAGWLSWTGLPGLAVVLVPVAAVTASLLPRAGTLWSVPALAPLLGVAGLAPVFIGLAALAGTITRRAGLAAAGLLWLVAAEQVTGDGLLLGPAGEAAGRAGWEGSASAGAREAVWPVLDSGMLLIGAVWAIAAILLAAVVRGRFVALDLVTAGAWAVALVFGHRLVADLIWSDPDRGSGHSLILGCACAAVIGAIAIALARHMADEPHEAPLPCHGEPPTLRRGHGGAPTAPIP